MPHAVETLAYSGEVPWHGLGVRVDEDITPEEMLVKADLDWEVELRPMFYKSKGKDVQSDKFALVRKSDEAYLSGVGPNWQPTQNREALTFFNEFVERGDMTMETAGSLKNGRHVFALARFSREFEVVANDVVKSYLLFHNPHIFGKSVEVMESSVRVVCNNTLTAALSDRFGKRYASSHRMEFDADEAKKVLGLAEKKFEEYEKAAKFLVSKQYTEELVQEFFQEVFPANDKTKLGRNAAMCKDALEYQPGVDIKGVAGTWWNAFNAVTYVTDHHLGRDQDGRMTNAWFGANRGKKVDALQKAVEYATKAA